MISRLAEKSRTIADRAFLPGVPGLKSLTNGRRHRAVIDDEASDFQRRPRIMVGISNQSPSNLINLLWFANPYRNVGPQPFL